MINTSQLAHHAGYVIDFACVDPDDLFAPAFLLGMGLCAMLCSFLLVKIIHLIGGDPDAADEESHDEER